MERAHKQALLEQAAADPKLWQLRRGVTFLNHGSFGSCPRVVLEFQRKVRARMEWQPCDFFVRDLEPLLDQAREALGAFVGADAQDLVFVPNATAGVNTVLRSLRFRPGDQVLVTNHEYNACRNALEHRAKECGARVVSMNIAFPLKSAAEVVEPLMNAVTTRTRLVLLDHVTSQTGVVLPIAQLAAEFNQLGIDTLIDGAHAPGMIPLNLRELGATYYTGNCHKWVCAPKGAGFLYVRRERQGLIHPLSISHGSNTARRDRSLFQIEFGWTGTWDPSAYLSVPKAIEFMGELLPGGWPAVMRRNRALVLAGREVLCRELGIQVPCPKEMIGALASVPLPDSQGKTTSVSPLYADAQQDELRMRYGIEVPIIPWPAAPKRLLRISAQLYNALPEYQGLGRALRRVLRG